MTSKFETLKVGTYSVIRQKDGTFRVVHTWTGAAVGTFAVLKTAIRAAREWNEDVWLLRTAGKETTLRILRKRNGFCE